MINRTTGKIPCILLALIIAFSAVAVSVCSAVITCGDAEAASGYTVYGIYNPNGVRLDSSDFDLYKVGDFNGSNFEYVDELKDVPVDIPVFTKKSDYDSEEEWQGTWMDSAAALKKYLPDGYEPVASAVTQNGLFQFDGIENGLYLLIGKSQKVWEGDKSVIWTPLPMYVIVLDEDTGSPDDRIAVKPSNETVVHDFTVVKSWSDEGHANVRPASIKVEVLYDGKVVKTVSLNADNDWSYSWHTDKTKHIWDCREVVTDKIRNNYEVDCRSVIKGDKKTIIITNTYNGDDPPVITGDTTKTPWLFIVICVTALALLTIFIINWRRNRREDSGSDEDQE